MTQVVSNGFRVKLVMRYTRISCMPFRATYETDRIVQAQSEHDAVRQACLCLDRELEQVLSKVNAINVAEVLVDIRSVEPAPESDRESEFWNPRWFPSDQRVPDYLVVTWESD